MVESIKVEIQPLTAKAFEPYGQMLENKQPIYPDVDPGEGCVAIEVKHVKPRPETTHMHQMAIHFSYNQTYIPLRGSMVLVVAPAPRNRDADLAAYEFDYQRVAGFIFKLGQAAHINKGVWHNTFMLGSQCKVINVTRKNPGEGTTVDVGGRHDVTHARRQYIDFVDIRQRDDRVLELDLGAVRDLIEA